MTKPSRSRIHRTAILILTLLPLALGIEEETSPTTRKPRARPNNRPRPNGNNNKPASLSNNTEVQSPAANNEGQPSGNSEPRPSENNNNNEISPPSSNEARPPPPSPNNKPQTPQIVRPIPPFVGLDTLLTPTTIDDDTSHGVVFDIETLPDSKVVRITDLEFYTSPTAVDEYNKVDYQVYIKSGSWHDATVREYSPLSSGNITLTTQEEEEYLKHRIPLETAIQLNGNSTRYAIYLGFSQRISLFQHPPLETRGTYAYITGVDYIPLLTTGDFIIYTGAAVMIYPLSKANHGVYYRKPRGFVGRIWYERDACKPSVSDWNECKRIKEVYDEQEREDEIEYGSTFYGGVKYSGGEGPTGSPAPTLDGSEVYLVITFGEAPMGKLMDDEAKSSFERVLFEYYLDQEVLAVNDVDLYSVKIWLQQYLTPEWDDDDDAETDADEQQQRLLQNNDATITQYQITAILTITHSSLPHLITRDLLVNALKDNSSPFFKSLKLTPELTPYLSNTGYISSIQSVEELTNAPSTSPTIAPTIPATEQVITREPTSPLTIAFIIILTIYTFTFLFSTCYLRKERGKMEHDRDMLKLLQSTTIQDDIRGKKSDFEGTQEEEVEESKPKKKGLGKLKMSTTGVGKFKMSLLRGSVTSKNSTVNSKENGVLDHSKKSLGEESGSHHSRERTSSAEDESYSEEEESYSEEESGSDDSSGRLSIT